VSTRLCKLNPLFRSGRMTPLSTAPARLSSAPSRPRRSRTGLLGSACTAAAACVLATAFSPAAEAGWLVFEPDFPTATISARPHLQTHKIGARPNLKVYQLGGKFRRKDTARDQVSKEPFGAIPPGPLQIIISIDQQQLHLYSGGVHVADTPVATGVPEHPTPLGVFSVIDKQRYHQSNIYSGAPMPYMQRITWSGVALHQGNGAGHRASHGCIRMPEAFAARLWVLHSLGARVVIARPELTLQEVADPHLFAHKDLPRPAPAAALEALKTAQTIDGARTSDAAMPAISGASAGGAAKGIDPADAAKSVAAELRLTKEATDAAADATSADALTIAAPAAGVVQNSNPSAPVRDAGVLANPLPASLQIGKSVDSPAAPPAKPAIDANLKAVPVPPSKPADLVRGAIGAPIAIFVSRKTGRIYVRRHFAPLFDSAIAIDRPDQPLGTHLFTAMEYSDNGSAFRWNVISLPGGSPKMTRSEKVPQRWGRWRRKEESDARVPDLPPPQTPQQALARIEIPQSVIDRISELMVTGSSLVISDQGLGEETGEGTDFVVVAR